MKGLMIKDLKLLMCQKMSLFLFLALTVIMMINGMDLSFCIGYALILMTMLMISTISYDEYENGMAFLFTMPVSRKEYVWSKYCIILSGIILVDAAMILVSVIYGKMQSAGADIQGYIVVSIILLFVAVFMMACLLPVNLKYGTEKGRIVLAVLAGAVGTIVFILSKYSDRIPYAVKRFFAKAELLSEWDAMIIFGAASLIAVIVSFLISCRVIEKKEY